MDRDPILQTREKTHGDFKINAIVAQGLKDVIHKWDAEGRKAVHREALDLICTKISRICSGSADFKDHWDDIAGYAKLGSEACD